MISPVAESIAVNVEKWLASLGLAVYVRVFQENHVEAETLSLLTMDDLREMGVTSVGHRRKILSAIASMERTQLQPVDSRNKSLNGERRQVTVLFADIARFSSLSAEMDAEQVHALLTTFFEKVDAIIAEFGGRIDKHIGDCTMAVFGAPVAHSDDVRRAVASALAIHAVMQKVSEAVGRVIHAHVGIASGEVVASSTGSSRYEEYTVTGETVNLASRLTGIARHTEIVASGDIITTLGESVEAEFAGSQPIKGYAKPVDIWRIHRLKDPADRPRLLIGRDAETDRCVAALQAVLNRDTGVVLYLRGEAGIGKSCLAAEASRRAEQLGFVGLRTALFDLGAESDRDPFRVLALALLSFVASSNDPTQGLVTYAAKMELAEPDMLVTKDLIGLTLSPDERRQVDAMEPGARLSKRGEALAALAIAAARQKPLFLVFEDVHWADATMLQSLGMMAHAVCGASKTVIAMTARTEADPLAVLDPLMVGVPVAIIELARLGERDARRLAADLLDTDNPLIEQCVARAGGNPLFLEQLIRHANSGGLDSALPGSIRSVVIAQVDRLPALEKSALQAAAALGHQFSADALRYVLGRTDWKADTLIESRLINLDNNALQFAHNLVRDGVYSSILIAERRRLHSVAAQWFSGRDAALHAEHLARAADPAAVSAFLEAAEERITAYRSEQALILLERAAGIAATPSESAAVSLRQGDLFTELGRPVEALAAYDRAAEAAPDQSTSAEAKLGKAGTFRLLDRSDEALALLEQAEPILVAGNRSAQLSKLEHLRGNLCYPLGRIAACQAAHEKALAYAERIGSIELKASALGGLGDAAFASGHFMTAERRFAECVELARRHGLGRVEVTNAPVLAGVSCYAVLGLTLAERAEAIESAIAAAANAHHARAEFMARQVAMNLYMVSEQREILETHFTRAREIALQIGGPRSLALTLGFMGAALFLLGDRAGATSICEEALDIAQDDGMELVRALVLACHALAACDDAELRRATLRESERVAGNTIAVIAFNFYLLAIEGCLIVEDWGEAHRFADGLATRFAEDAPFVMFLAKRGQLLAELGESRPDAPLKEALHRCRELGQRMGYSLFLRRLDEALATKSI